MNKTPAAANVLNTPSSQGITLATPSSSATKGSLDVSSTQDTNSVIEETMKKELHGLLRDIYIKYPSAQDDDQVETMALQLKGPLLANNKDRVRELRMELKVYLISHHGSML